jgi:hypothetical protein
MVKEALRVGRGDSDKLVREQSQHALQTIRIESCYALMA